MQDDEIGMVWDVPDYLFEKNYAALLDYYKKNGNADVPSYYVSADGFGSRYDGKVKTYRHT